MQSWLFEILVVRDSLPITRLCCSLPSFLLSFLHSFLPSFFPFPLPYLTLPYLTPPPPSSLLDLILLLTCFAFHFRKHAASLGPFCRSLTTHEQAPSVSSSSTSLHSNVAQLSNITFTEIHCAPGMPLIRTFSPSFSSTSSSVADQFTLFSSLCSCSHTRR
jgi:hypothetical protein